MHNFFNSFISILVDLINQIGYLGIFIGMFLESTLVPIPSEVIMIPAGIAASKGFMNIYAVTIFGILGNVAGAVFSYYLAKILGRKILLKIGKYFFVKPKTITNIETFFKDHGNISVFLGRLLPGFRHFISLPAGIAQMNLKAFYIYTILGSTIWTSVLSALGFFVGNNQELIGENLNKIAVICLVLSCLVLALYIAYKKVSKPNLHLK
jgi:membrane protein DedA with SNARE-associated domain